MGFWEIIVIGSIGFFVKKMINSADEAAEKRKRLQREEEKRKRKRCCFNDGISEEIFHQIVKQSVRYIKRLTYFYIDGSIVYGTVRANSGLSEWNFKIDFNDYGHITGKYWLESDNVESNVPTIIAERISSMIRSFPAGFEQSKSSSKCAAINAYEKKSEKYNAMWQNMWREMNKSTNGTKKKSVKSKIRIFFCIVLLGVLVYMTFLWYK